MITTSLIFDHRARTKDGHEGPIEVRVTIDRVVRYASTGVKCLKKHWQHGVVVDRYDCDELNERLQLIKKKVEAEVNRCIKECEDLNLPAMRKNLVSLDYAKKGDFLEWAENEVPLLKVSEGRRKHFDTLILRLTEFNKITSWSDLTVENIFAFDRWLHDLPSNLEQSTIYSYHKNLKAILNRAYKLGKLDADKNPYSRLRGEFPHGDKENIEYLTEEEMNRICALTPKPGTEFAKSRDLFVVQMYTGLSYSDAEALDLSNYKFEDGRWVNNGTRIKTGVAFVSQLLPPVVAVLNKYDWNVPQIALQHYNENLKLIGTAAGISTRMHSHLARHTFATYMLRNGVTIENLARMLGHRRITQTMKYAKVLATSVHDDFDKVSKLLEK